MHIGVGLRCCFNPNSDQSALDKGSGSAIAGSPPIERPRRNADRIRSACGGNRSADNGPTRPERPCVFSVCVSLPPPSAPRCFLSYGRSGTWPRAPTPRPATKQKPGRRRQGRAKEARRVRRGREAAGRPGRQSGMRLARPAGGQSAVAGRSRHRLPASRSLRPLRLPGRPHPGDVPLPGPAGQHRSEGDRTRSTAASTPAGSIRATRRRAPPAAPGVAAARQSVRMFRTARANLYDCSATTV